ncbi:hypothetical protein ACQPXH_20570 [Nocardia sp. CA-135953]|uniref:hypothetical protein n=1 Tax=Nocardia sp. CA-135953 TaxID=3239978 RepID=UPI003D957C09
MAADRSATVELCILTAARPDPTWPGLRPHRAINRLRATLLEHLPALKRAFDYSADPAVGPQHPQ